MSSFSFSPDTSNVKKLRKMESLKTETKNTDFDERDSDFLTPKLNLRIFQNKTKLTRDNISRKLME